MLGRLAHVVACSPWHVWAIAGGLAVFALFGMRRIEVDSDFMNYFGQRSKVRQANRIINREIVGSNPFYVVVEGPEAGALRQWVNLWLVKDLQQYLRTLPGITSSVSIVDYLELLESGLNTSGGGDLVIDEHGNPVPAPRPRPFWEDRAQLEPVLKMVSQSPETFSSVVTPDFKAASILVRTTLSGSRAIEETLTRIREYVANRFPAELRVRLTGNLVLLSGTTSEIVAGQVKSLALALSVIFVVLSLMFLSVRIGLLAILPNVFPILLFFGVMGWLGIDLNLGTSLIAAIVLGIAVDSTIHYMARLNRELRGETDQQAAITRTHPARRGADHLRHRGAVRRVPGLRAVELHPHPGLRPALQRGDGGVAQRLPGIAPVAARHASRSSRCGTCSASSSATTRRTPSRSSPGCVRRRPGWWCSWAISAASPPARRSCTRASAATRCSC